MAIDFFQSWMLWVWWQHWPGALHIAAQRRSTWHATWTTSQTGKGLLRSCRLTRFVGFSTCENCWSKISLRSVLGWSMHLLQARGTTWRPRSFRSDCSSYRWSSTWRRWTPHKVHGTDQRDLPLGQVSIWPRQIHRKILSPEGGLQHRCEPGKLRQGQAHQHRPDEAAETSKIFYVQWETGFCTPCECRSPGVVSKGDKTRFGW